MKLRATKDIFYKAIMIILFILVLYVTYCSIFNIYRNNLKMSPTIIICGMIICIFGFIRIKKIIEKLSEKTVNIIAIVICIVFFIALSIFGSNIIAVPTFDLSDIQKEVDVMLNNGGIFTDEEGYFSIYPAQCPVTILIYYIYSLGKFLGAKDLRLFATIINCAFISITAFFTYLSVKQVKCYKLAFLTLIFFIINPAFYVYTSWFYTHTFSLPFAIISIYLFVLAEKQQNNTKRMLQYIASGFILSIGFKIRVVTAILLIAMIIGMFLNNKFGKKVIKSIIYLILGFLLGIIAYNIISLPFNIKLDKDKQLPPTHWMMMALEKDTLGSWNSVDYFASISKETYEEKVEYSIEKIKERVKDFRLRGLIEISKLKISRNWSNGDYDYISVLNNVQEVTPIYEYISGNTNIFMQYYCQILKATVMFVFLILILNEFKKTDENKKYSIIYIAIFGAFLFYLLWEVSPRYSYSFLPWLILTFGIGITYIENVLSIEKINLKFKNNKILVVNFKKVIKVTIIIVIIITIITMVINYFELTEDEATYLDTVLMSMTTSQLDSKNVKIANNKVEQTFKTSNSFDVLTIKFRNEGTSTNTKYKIALYNSNGQEIFKTTFNSENIKDNETKIFRFNEIYPDGEEEFTIRIYSEDATEDNSIGVAVMDRNGFDIFVNGEMRINDVVDNGDMLFKVYNKVERTYISKKFFIILCGIIILIETYSFEQYVFSQYKNLLKEKKNEAK